MTGNAGSLWASGARGLRGDREGLAEGNELVNLSASDIVSRRLAAQQLCEPYEQGAEQIVAWLGGVQAQDYVGAKWSIGLRARSTEAEVEKAIADLRIVRTWVFRGTLHLIAAADVSWLLALLAPAIIAANERRYRQLGLDEATFSKSTPLICRMLESGRPYTRNEIRGLLENEGISTKGQRAPYLLQRAALDGAICLGPQRGWEPTYALLSEQMRTNTFLTRIQALTALVERYFASHGPATVQDFCWWSGLSTLLVREALENTSSVAAVDGTDFWAGIDKPADPSEPAHLLSRFDEYLLGYKDRSSALDPVFSKKINAGGGMPRPAIILNGNVVGLWKQFKNKDRILVSAELFRSLEDNEAQALEIAVQQYGRYLDSAMDLRSSLSSG